MSKILLIASVFILSSCNNHDKVGFIDLVKTFDHFEYKKELQGKLEAIKIKRQSFLDSLELELKILSKNLDNKDSRAVFEVKKESFFLKKDEFENSNAILAKDFDDKIIKQLNQYVRDYGVLNKYEFIHGANGSGSIMYADSTKDITNEVVQFINQKFKGK